MCSKKKSCENSTQQPQDGISEWKIPGQHLTFHVSAVITMWENIHYLKHWPILLYYANTGRLVHLTRSFLSFENLWSSTQWAILTWSNSSFITISLHIFPLSEYLAFKNCNLLIRNSLSHFTFVFSSVSFFLLSPLLHCQIFEAAPTFYSYLLLRVFHCYHLNQGIFPVRQDWWIIMIFPRGI